MDTKVEVRKPKLSAEAVRLLNEIFEQRQLAEGELDLVEVMKAETAVLSDMEDEGKVEHQLRQRLLKVKDSYRKGKKDEK